MRDGKQNNIPPLDASSTTENHFCMILQRIRMHGWVVYSIFCLAQKSYRILVGGGRKKAHSKFHLLAKL